MTMTINGSGSITGLVSGGLPNGVVLPANTQLGALPSMIRVNTANGYGSTNTTIRRFTNIVTNQGSDITYADSATLGASFTINTNGVYNISYNDQFNVGNLSIGISLNTSQPTIAIGSINIADILVTTNVPAANQPSACGTCVYLPAGSVIRAHTTGTSSGTAVNSCQFTITRVA